jgi:ADP-heptose:LPS heptosyltransferase
MTDGGAKARTPRTPRTPRGTPLNGRYLASNRALLASLRLSDAWFARFSRAEPAAVPADPSRILIAVGGHLGDALIATSVIPVLTHAFPNAELGMLLPSWSRAAVQGHPRIRWVHHADHWKLNRSPDSRAKKWRIHRSTSTAAIDAIREVKYDVAVDLYAYYPNSARILAEADIPVRIGYTSGGGGPLYTHPVDWSAAPGHTANQHRRLLTLLLGNSSLPTSEPHYDLPPIDSTPRGQSLSLTAATDYCVVHPGTGDPKKAWPSQKWRELIRRLNAAGHSVVLTGVGENERLLAATLAGDQTKVLNLVGQLDWQTFRAVLESATAVIGLDSAATHASAAANTRTIAIMGPLADPAFWRPLGECVHVLDHEASVDDVLTALEPR